MHKKTTHNQSFPGGRKGSTGVTTPTIVQNQVGERGALRALAWVLYFNNCNNEVCVRALTRVHSKTSYVNKNDCHTTADCTKRFHRSAPHP